MNRKMSGVSLIAFGAALAGLVISFLLLQEDITSTAKTIFEYFPSKYGVTPASTWQGAVILGLFVSVLEIITASIAFSDKFGLTTRLFAGVILIGSGYFDNWTDIVFRSGYGTGNMRVATLSTMMFYTFGSEVTQGLSWVILFTMWRAAISDIIWGYFRFIAGMSSISSEVERFKKAAFNKERGGQPYRDNKPTYKPTYQPVTNQHQANPKNAQKPQYRQPTLGFHSVHSEEESVPKWMQGE